MILNIKMLCIIYKNVPLTAFLQYRMLNLKKKNNTFYILTGTSKEMNVI